jgi:hypothetical protein
MVKFMAIIPRNNQSKPVDTTSALLDAEAVGFVDDEVPGDLLEVGRAGGREVIRADSDMVGLAAGGTAFQDYRREGEFWVNIYLANTLCGSLGGAL